jgi:hypothetical protein
MKLRLVPKGVEVGCRGWSSSLSIEFYRISDLCGMYIVRDPCQCLYLKTNSALQSGLNPSGQRNPLQQLNLTRPHISKAAVERVQTKASAVSEFQ